jgi:hypothetical protein
MESWPLSQELQVVQSVISCQTVLAGAEIVIVCSQFLKFGTNY